MATIEALVAERVLRRICAWYGPELVAWALRDCADWPAPGPSTASPARRGRTPTSSRSTGRVRRRATQLSTLNVEEFGSLAEAHVITEVWRIEYNTYRRTRLLAVSPPTSTPGNGPPNASHHSHSGLICHRNGVPSPLWWWIGDEGATTLSF